MEGLANRHKYRFRVIAVNKIGRSQPCEMTGDDILIKDPWGKKGELGGTLSFSLITYWSPKL